MFQLYARPVPQPSQQTQWTGLRVVRGVFASNMKHPGHYWLACSPRGPLPRPAPARLPYTPSLLARTVDAWAGPPTGVAGMQLYPQALVESDAMDQDDK